MTARTHNSRQTRRRSRAKPPRAALSRLSEARLLDLRICDLDLRIEGSWLDDMIDRLYGQLERRGLDFQPNVWLSTEWFAPDGIPGIGVPFYLAHPRLMKLERKMMYKVEGGSRDECLKLLRHEAGHAIDNAFRLNRRKRYRELFGRYSDPYPDYYRPNPNTENFVQHLSLWYAQSHPAEDFAETFAIWLTPKARWRQRYRGWGALRKLEYIDELMTELAGEKPPVRSRRRIDPIREIRKTLGEHYHEKRMRYLNEWPDFYDRDLRKLFSDDPHYGKRPTAAQFLREIRPDLRATVAEWTGLHPYTIDQVLQDMIDRCRELKLRCKKAQRVLKTEATIMVTVQTMNFLYRGRYWIPV